MRSLLLTIYLLTVTIVNAQESTTSIGFALSPSFSSIQYVDNGSFQSSDIELIEAGTTGSIGLSGKVFFEYELSEKFLITWGLGIQNYKYSTSYYKQTLIEHPTIERETKYNQHYLEFMASAKYRIYEMLYARAGIGADILVEQRAKRTETCPTCDYYYQGGDNSAHYNSVLMPVFLGVGYELKLNDKLNLMAELFGSMSLTNAFDNTYFSDQVQLYYSSVFAQHLNQRPVQLGFSLGVIRSF